MAKIDIVIVNWNSGDQLRECLASLARTAPRDILGQVMVIDNASSDNSLVNIEKISLPMRVIRNRENRGFAAACNQGAAAASADFILFLNPDTKLTSDALFVPLTLLSKPDQAGVGICGIQLLDEQGRVARSCSRLPTPGILIAQSLGLNRILSSWFPSQAMTEWDHGSTRTLDQVIGAFFLVRREVFESLGGFDERFYVYFEEVDFSLRARTAGWRTLYLADVQAYHRGCGASEHAKAHRLFYSLQSRMLYAAKHFSKLGAGMVIAATLLVEPWTRLAWSALRCTPSEMWETLRGYSLLWDNIPRILSVGWEKRLPKRNLLS